MRFYASPSTILVLAISLSMLGCTQLGRLRGMQAAAEVTCVGGRVADAAGEDAGGVVAAAACWLADYLATRVERLESKEAADRADAEHEQEIDDAIRELDAALAVCDPVAPTFDQEAAVARAWAKCRLVTAD